jgi:hypothetical protein
MANKFVTDRIELNEAPANNDVLHIVDVSDVGQNPAGSSKKIKVSRLLEKTVLVPYRFISTSQAITIADTQIECGNSITITLPSAVGITGKSFGIKNTGGGIVTVTTTNSQTIDGKESQEIHQWENLVVLSNGVNWVII